ncbi:MAG: hypothetical protein C4308_06645 [Chitinophagaceae bacterium]
MLLPTSITTRLEYQHKSLLEIIEGLSDEQIRRPVITGKWSIFENIVHLAVYQHLFINRIRKILSENNPAFEQYTPDIDPEFADNCTKTTREIMQDLITTRRELITGIHSLTASDLHKKGKHSAYGNLSLKEWLNFFLLHEAHHLFTIFKLTAELRNSRMM